jgi:hypothetical protein
LLQRVVVAEGRRSRESSLQRDVVLEGCCCRGSSLQRIVVAEGRRSKERSFQGKSNLSNLDVTRRYIPRNRFNIA